MDVQVRWWVVKGRRSATRMPPRFRIDEPDIALTDIGLAVETGIFAVLIARRTTHRQRLRRWTASLFATASASALAGGIDHGFLRRGGRELAHHTAWGATLLAIGGSALSLAGLGAELGLSRATARRVIGAAAVLTAAYSTTVLVITREFVVAILAYAPAALFLLAMLVQRLRQYRDRGSLLGTVAVVLAFAAAAAQGLKIGVPALSLSHSAVYHVIQATSFALLFAAARDLLKGAHQ